MRKLLVSVLLLVATALFSFGTPAMAAGDAAAGAAIFTGNCQACHAGGGNIIKPGASLSKADLEKNGKYSVDAIYDQVMKGQAPMPPFAYLGKQKVADVAAYVYDQASKNKW